MAAKRSYIVMRTTTRLNYRTACSFNAGTIAGVFDEGTAIPVLGKDEVTGSSPVSSSKKLPLNCVNAWFKGFFIFF